VINDSRFLPNPTPTFSILKVVLAAVWIVIITQSCADALSFPQATRDLQDESLTETANLQETQARIAACPQCRSADEIQQTGFLRALFGQIMLWWFQRRVDATRFVDVLKNTEIKVDPTQWTNMREQWTAQAQTLRQQDSSSTSSSEVLLQYQSLLTDLSASSLEGVSTLMDLAGFERMDNTVPLDHFTCRVLTITYFFNRIVLPNIAIVGDAWRAVTVGAAVEESAASLVLELLDNSTSTVLDRYANALLTSCAEEDESFVQLQDTAESLTLDLTEKRNSFVLYSSDQILPSISAETTNPFVMRIQAVLQAIVLFPVFWLFLLPVLFFAFSSQDNSVALNWIMGVALILILLVSFPFVYIFVVVATLLGSNVFRVPFYITMDNESIHDTIDHMTLLKSNPFLFSVNDIKCQVQKYSCESDAWVQVFAPSP
jgi:hypothetical protein